MAALELHVTATPGVNGTSESGADLSLEEGGKDKDVVANRTGEGGNC